ncbi:hypothetical protein ANO14919_055140 [Xylariales sp. No.14919]|nr:hypothetical protein ANO14919_055140 [Xylariales sp. No.14919]
MMCLLSLGILIASSSPTSQTVQLNNYGGHDNIGALHESLPP